MLVRAPFAMLLLLLVASAGAFAGDCWPEFRGPTADGHSHTTGIPLTWSETEHVSWKTPLSGWAFSSPVIWDGRIWMTTASEDGTELSAICVAADTGDVLLERKIFDVANPAATRQFNSYASPTPVIESGRVYLSWGSYGVACLDTASGEVIWSRRDLECNHYRGPGSSPVIFEDLLIQHYDGFDHQYVVALDKVSGDTVWRTERRDVYETDNGDLKKAFATPIIIEVDGRPQLISPAAKATFAYDPFTGEELWYVRYPQHSTATRPLSADGLVFISTGFGKAQMLAVRPTGSGDVTETHVVWSEPNQMPSKPSPLLIDGLLYVISDDGVAVCLDATSGERVWRERVGGDYSASPIYTDGRICFFSEDGKTTVIAPGREYEVLAENHLADEGFMASPALADGAMFLRSETSLYRIGNPASTTGAD
jgi:outer membrane protein assembly factor BamB